MTDGEEYFGIVEESDENIAVIVYHPDEETPKETIAEAIENFLLQFSQKVPENFYQDILGQMEVVIREHGPTVYIKSFNKMLAKIIMIFQEDTFEID